MLKKIILCFFVILSMSSRISKQDEFDPVRLAGKWFFWGSTFGVHFNDVSTFFDIHDNKVDFTHYGSGFDDNGNKYWFMSELIHQDGKPLNEYTRFNYLGNMGLDDSDPVVIVETDYTNIMIFKVIMNPSNEWVWTILGREEKPSNEKFEAALKQTLELSGLDRSKFDKYD